MVRILYCYLYHHGAKKLTSSPLPVLKERSLYREEGAKVDPAELVFSMQEIHHFEDLFIPFSIHTHHHLGYLAFSPVFPNELIHRFYFWKNILQYALSFGDPFEPLLVTQTIQNCTYFVQPSPDQEEGLTLPATPTQSPKRITLFRGEKSLKLSRQEKARATERTRQLFCPT
jgi:hypothetical protein